LESSQALDLITTEVKIGFISTSIPVILFTAASAIAIYAYLARRKRRSKFDLASDKTLARIREQQAAAAIKKKSVKVSKRKSVGTKKKPKSTK
jgi:beta-lactamase regulating signal transducer with metallopeptidase domain